jgi:hypothetical protein
VNRPQWNHSKIEKAQNKGKKENDNEEVNGSGRLFKANGTTLGWGGPMMPLFEGS